MPWAGRGDLLVLAADVRSDGDRSCVVAQPVGSRDDRRRRGQSARIGLFAYMSFLALVSISLGVLNLLPVPVLDGGTCCTMRSRL